MTPWHVLSLIWVLFGPWGSIFSVQNRFSHIFPASEGSPFLTVNITVKLARLGQNWFRLVLLNRINTADVIGYFFLPTGHFSFAPHIHTPSAIRFFQGISSRPFIGENVFWSVPQNRMSTENAVGCLFLSLTLTFYCFHKFAVPHAAFCSKRPNRISHGSNSDFFWIWHVFWTLSIGCVYVGQRKSTRLVNKK